MPEAKAANGQRAGRGISAAPWWIIDFRSRLLYGPKSCRTGMAVSAPERKRHRPCRVPAGMKSSIGAHGEQARPTRQPQAPRNQVVNVGATGAGLSEACCSI